MHELFVKQNKNLLEYKKKRNPPLFSSALHQGLSSLSTPPKTAQLPGLAPLFPADIKKIDVNPVDIGKHHSKYG